MSGGMISSNASAYGSGGQASNPLTYQQLMMTLSDLAHYLSPEARLNSSRDYSTSAEIEKSTLRMYRNVIITEIVIGVLFALVPNHKSFLKNV